MWRKIIFFFELIIAFSRYGATSIFEESDFVRPDTVKDYLDARDNCKFEPYAADTNFGCPGLKMESCDVETNLPEGKGYVRIVRMGPFTTTGGGQEWKCDIKDSASLRDEVSYVTRSFVALTEPNTGMFISYPPL